tara:strand:- start:1120 stop:1842 length:723 start_codon:yes stop_codon:yes gene_type:complete
MSRIVKYILVIIGVNIIQGEGSMKEISLIFKKKNQEEVDLNYLLYLPNDYQRNKQDYPLVLFLHGKGERGDDLEKIKIHGIPKRVDEGIKFPFICIAPQCPDEGYWDRPEYVSSLISLLKEVENNYRVDSKRIYGTGLSMGGLGTLAIALKNPTLFSAIIPVCGGAKMENIQRLSQLPIWLFHGDRDDVHPVNNSIIIFQALSSVNDQVFLTVYGGVDHDSWTQTYENHDIYNWMLNYSK